MIQNKGIVHEERKDMSSCGIKIVDIVKKNKGIVNENLAISKEKRKLIFELSLNPLFIHPVLTVEGKLRKYGGKPYYSEIAKNVGCDKQTVSNHLKFLHKKMRKEKQTLEYKEKIKPYKKKYNQLEEVKYKKRIYQQKNKIKMKEYQKKYRKTDKSINFQKEYQKKYRLNKKMTSIVHKLKETNKEK